ncbi:unnamed protein product [Didymodactylos carnosus]|uniref:Retrotransposon gag domain-containing protein n=1 Tax=Didymodactylos carnosus TaxID=1234261 RepID=A0A816EN67_9BILA|nr:unnamed protein product [Didymodactylos carnosus]CAF1648200.1 unnamed protein product [Didymodactylos carnosus]CAF4301297.1 unnamed protein product [Didymodactylos carnosus]CAF4571208.1 unnamed protein product [Didymodactylos carnosus]
MSDRITDQTTNNDQIVQYLLRKTLEERTPRFYGRTDEDITNWVKTVTTEFMLAKCPDHEKLEWIPSFLREEALEWYVKHIDQIDSWEKFCDQIQEKHSLVETQPCESKPAAVVPINTHSFHPQHYQINYDEYVPTIQLNIKRSTMMIVKYEELQWPAEKGTWLEYTVKQQRERFRKTKMNDCEVLNKLINSDTLLSLSADTETNDDQQLQNGVIGPMHKGRRLLLPKLHGTMKELGFKMELQPTSLSSFQFAPFNDNLSSSQSLSFRNNTTTGKRLLVAIIADIYEVLDHASRLLACHKMVQTADNRDRLWQFMVP